jgi:tetratricopeptide (TPR) repeat protein
MSKPCRSEQRQGCRPRPGMYPLKPLLCAAMFAMLLGPARAQAAQATASAADMVQVKQAMRSGAAAMHEGRLGEAETAFRRVITIAPMLPDGHMDLGLLLVREGKVEEAIPSLETAARLNPELPGVQMFLGIAYYQTDSYDRARAALQREIDRSPSSAEALMWLGVVNLAAGDPEKAIAPLDRAAELAPRDLNILDYRGRAHSLVSRNSYTQMYQVDPDSWHVHRALGQTYSEAGKPNEAIAEYQAAIRQEPKNSDLYESLGNEYQKAGQFDLAERAYNEELTLSPRNAVAMFNLGKLRVEHNDAHGGVALLEQVVKLYSHSGPSYYYLGLAQSRINRDREAAESLEKAAAAAPSGEITQRAYYELSRVYRRLQRPRDAEQALAKFVKLKAELDKRSATQVEDFRRSNTAPASIGSPAHQTP